MSCSIVATARLNVSAENDCLLYVGSISDKRERGMIPSSNDLVQYAICNYQPPVVERRLIMYSVLYVHLFVCVSLHNQFL